MWKNIIVGVSILIIVVLIIILLVVNKNNDKKWLLYFESLDITDESIVNVTHSDENDTFLLSFPTKLSRSKMFTDIPYHEVRNLGTLETMYIILQVYDEQDVVRYVEAYNLSTDIAENVRKYAKTQRIPYVSRHPNCTLDLTAIVSHDSNKIQHFSTTVEMLDIHESLGTITCTFRSIPGQYKPPSGKYEHVSCTIDDFPDTEQLRNLMKLGVVSDLAPIMNTTDFLINTMIQEGTSLEGKLTVVRTFNVNKDHVFYDFADTYDNAIAIMFFTSTYSNTYLQHRIPMFAYAEKLTNSWIKLLVMAGWNTENTDGMRLLNSRYRPDGTWYSEQLATENMSRDIGNNTYMAIAFVKFSLTFFPKLKYTIYIRAAECILLYISKNRKMTISNNTGYRGRQQIENVAPYLSTEHHIDLYALCNILLLSSSDPNVTSTCTEMKKVIRTFMDGMYDSNSNTYLIGSNPDGQAIPVDCQTWSILAGLDDNDTKRQERTLEWVVNNCLYKDKTGYGFKFTNRGQGIQLENTGSGLMALLRYSKHNNSEKFDTEIEQIRNTMYSVNSVNGVHSSYQKEPESPGNSYNTGLTWSYFDIPHTASTIYCTLALMYLLQQDDNKEVYNPYSTLILPSSDVRVPLLTKDSFRNTNYQYNMPYIQHVHFKTGNNMLDIDTLFGYFINNPLWFYEINIRQDGVCSYFNIETIKDLGKIADNVKISTLVPELKIVVLRYIFIVSKRN